jgi:hypothetical protein
MKVRRLSVLQVLGDLMRGGRHSRRTLARMGVSLPTADRWLKQLEGVPGVRRVSEGKTRWLEWRGWRTPQRWRGV